MIVPLKVVVILVLAAFIFFTGYVLGHAIGAKRCSGRLIIDKTGEKDRWSFILDDAVEDVENDDFIRLRIEKHE